MKRKITLARALCIFLPIMIVLCIFTVQLCYRFMYLPAQGQYKALAAELSQKYEETDQLIIDLKEIKELFDGKYVGELEEEQIIEQVLDAYVQATGDRYAKYYTAKEYEEQQASYEGQGVGVGMRVFITQDGRILVAYVEKDSPAHKAGILPGDEVIAVGDEKVSEIGTDKASELMLGQEGSEAVFTVKNADGQREVSITRQAVSYSTVLYDLENGMGYVRILSFGKNTPKEFSEAVDALQRAGAKALIFDVRQNGGGLLDSVHEMLDYLIEDGKEGAERVVAVTVDNKQNEKQYVCGDEHSVDLPMAVLVDGQTASASELFAAALRDYEMAVIVGQTTYGKGVAQTTYLLDDGSAVRLTTALYNPPSGENYDGKGVEPSISASSEGLNIYLTPHSEDPVYIAAQKELNNK
ncbi:MAG: PDZ domain-containing protein [Clostridia bacterium]|nr:PDZ domain-containing protein [Clostridia bacterium]